MALLLRYSQQVLIKLYRRGERGLTDLFSYSTKLVMDVAADFVIREGGWVSRDNNLYKLYKLYLYTETTTNLIEGSISTLIF